MIVNHKVKDLKKILSKENFSQKRIGFVPTMGALHDGHLAIIRRSLIENDYTVASIFINPTQFNNREDYDKYPVSISKDIELLEMEKCDLVFLPSVSEMYPEGTNTKLKFEPGYFDTIMEGSFRPGHFRGVAQVVKRLIDVVSPDVMYLGQKDFQQYKLIEKMISDLNIDVELRMAETIREKDGLAMSSRNRRLSESARKNAAEIYRILKTASDAIKSKSIEKIRNEAINALKTIPDSRFEYFEIADKNSFQILSSVSENKEVVICCAVWIDGVRLIDNIIYDQ
jgi:pantoate--beta-alanine ligase